MLLPSGSQAFLPRIPFKNCNLSRTPCQTYQDMMSSQYQPRNDVSDVMTGSDIALELCKLIWVQLTSGKTPLYAKRVSTEASISPSKPHGDGSLISLVCFQT